MSNIGGNVRWHGDRWKAAMRQEARRRNSACVIGIHNHAKKLIGIEGTGSAIKKHAYRYGRETRSVNKRGIVYGFVVSDPGEPPRKQTGRLQSSVAWELVSDLVARVGTNVRYGRWLELGTRLMAARPWLRRSLREMTPFCQAVWNRPWRMTA